MTAQAHDTTTDTTPPSIRPAAARGRGLVQLTQRDIDGLLLCGEHYGAPYDLLAAALRVRRSGCPRSWRAGAAPGTWPPGGSVPGPGWCWLTRDGMAATGLGFPAGRPALARLAHIRAVLAARLWLAGRAGLGGGPGRGGIPNGGCAPTSQRRGAAGTCRMRRSTGPASRQPVRGADLGDRGRADTQAGRPGPRGS